MVLRAVEADGQLRRLFSVMHMRFSDHDHRMHEYTIDSGFGIRMQGSAPSDAVVTGDRMRDAPAIETAGAGGGL